MRAYYTRARDSCLPANSEISLFTIRVYIRVNVKNPNSKPLRFRYVLRSRRGSPPADPQNIVPWFARPNPPTNQTRKENNPHKTKGFPTLVCWKSLYLLGLLRIVSANGLVRFPYIVSSSPRIALIIHPCGFFARCAWSRLLCKKSASFGARIFK